MATTSSNTVPDKWDASRIPSLKDKVVVITGANSGIGFVAAREMVRKGAHVVIACRNEERGKAAVQKLESELQDAAQKGKVEFMQLDVSDLSSVKKFSSAFLETHDRLDVLVNNAGIMGLPHSLSVDGVENQFATNHLGHFALTSQLFDILKKSAPSRVINTSSVAHREAKLDLDNIVAPKEKYAPMKVYSNTKLYNLVFTMELDRRIKASGVDGVSSIAVHPGVTDTNLFSGPLKAGIAARMTMKFASLFPLWQKVEMGALPTLYAATAPGVKSGDYYGCNGFQNFWGYPTLEEPQNQSKSEAAGAKLWDVSELLAKQKFTME
uniref:WW domain-containing oxidoreductase n=1 Tax=Globisporangium ultimum (strain ATCC 200006 / CBS 805.95 / DAOM BR144) TaxID=431595 RepID=K3WZY8_GLOUD